MKKLETFYESGILKDRILLATDDDDETCMVDILTGEELDRTQVAVIETLLAGVHDTHQSTICKTLRDLIGEAQMHRDTYLNTSLGEVTRQWELGAAVGCETAITLLRNQGSFPGDKD